MKSSITRVFATAVLTVAVGATTAFAQSSSAQLPFAQPTNLVQAAQGSGEMIPPGTALYSSSRNIYVRLDGSYETQETPGLSLGLKNWTSAFTDNGFAVSFQNQRSTGYGIRGGVGYLLPDGIVPPNLGAQPRVELGVNYANTTASSNNDSPAGGGFATGAQLLSGTVVNNAWYCGNFGFTCPQSSSLLTRSSNWRLAAKVASDFHNENLTITPSIALMGGVDNTSEALTQNLVQIYGGANIYGDGSSYSSNIELHSNNVGAKGGLDLHLEINDWLSLGAGGSLGVVYRDTSFHGSDVFIANGTGGSFAPSPGTSTISTGASTAAVLGTVEARVNITPIPGVLLHGFIGCNYDSQVPRITAPSYAGPATAPTGTTASTIGFSGKVGWYTGGGVTVRF